MINKTFDIATFKKMQGEMVAKNDQSWKSTYGSNQLSKTRDYTLEEINRILNSGSLFDQQKLSRNYFNKDGLYKRIIMYYATLLTYDGLLVPHPSFGKQLNSLYTTKRYNSALEFLEKIHVKEFMTRMSLRALIDGSYYGILQVINKNQLVLFDLPTSYCRSRYLDLSGNDIIEFDVRYFNTIFDKEEKNEALSIYPKMVSSYYKKYCRGQVTNPWIQLPSDVGIYFTFFDEGRPLFLDVIPSSVQYDDAVETERERELEEIRKIIVQKIPHTQDGQLLFEPEEAVEIHQGTVGMLRGNKNLSVLTTYADVDAIVSKTSNENASNSVEKMLYNVYSRAGASSQLFAPTGSQALSTSIENDMSLMMILGNKYSRFITNIINQLFGNFSISFSYSILPLSLYNKSDFITDSLKLAQSGYSFLLPAIAVGLNQRELIDIKSLENNILKMSELLIPLSSSFTQSNKESGAPEKKLEDKAIKTIQNENAINNQGGPINNE